MSDKERLAYAITLDTAQLEAAAKKASNEFKNMGKDIEKEGKRITNTFENIGGKSLAGIAMDSLGEDIGRSRLEIEQTFSRIDRMSSEAFGNMSIKARQLAKDIQDDTMTLKRLEMMQTALNDTYEKGGVSLNEYLTAQARLAVLHDQVSNAISDNEQALRTETAIMEITEDSIVALQAKVSLLTVEYMKLSQAQREGTEGQAILKNLTEVQNKLQQATASMNQYARSAGAKFDGLNFSIQQIARELPVLAMSPQMFFLAISNNLPIFTDELAKARKEYQLLTEAGKSATPVWKRVLSSMFSWQTALVGGITLLTVYGDEITKWIGSLFSAEKALSETYQSLEEWQNEVSEASGKVLTTLERLSQEWIKLGGNVNAQEEYIIKNKNAFDETGIAINSVADAENLLITNKDAFINAIMLKAKAAATIKLAAKEYEKSIQKMLEADDREAKGITIGDRLKSWFARAFAGEDLSGTLQKANLSPEAFFKEAVDELRKDSGKHETSMTELIKKALGIDDESQKEIGKAGGKAKDVLVKNSIEAIRASISDKQERLNKMDVSSSDFKKLQTEIKKEQDMLNAVTGRNMKTDNRKEIDNQQRLHEELMSLRFQNQQDEINLMVDGAEKKRKQLELDYQKEYSEILALEKKWTKLGGGKLTMEQQVEISRKYTNAENKLNSGIAAIEGGFSQEELNASMNAYLATYGTYIEKRNAIIAQAAAKKVGKNEWEQKSIDEETKRALSDLDIEANKTTSAISKLFGDMKDKTLSDLRQINEQGQAALEFLKSGEWDEDKGKQFGITKETFELWSKSPEKLKHISDALRDNKRAADELRPAYEKIADGLKKLFNSGNDTKKLNEALADIQEGLNEIMQVGSFLSDTFSNLGDAFGSDALSGIAEGINVAMDAASSAMSGAAAGAMLGPIGAAAGAAVGLVSSLVSSIAQIHDAKIEKNIQRLQEQVDTLETSYEDLDRAIEKAYSSDASKLIEQQNTLLEQQKVLIEQQIREEQDKKDTDDERIKEWQDKLHEIDIAIADNKEKMLDAIFGEDVQTAIDRFAEAWAEALASGEKPVNSLKDAIKDMAKNSVMEQIKQYISNEGMMDVIRGELKWQLETNNGKLTEKGYEALMRDAEEYEKMLKEKFGWADYLFKDDEEDAERKGTKKGIATASQDSVDENNARLTTIQGHTFSIMDGLNTLNVTANRMLEHLAGIESNTAGTNERLDETNVKIDGMDRKINRMSDTLDDINTKGLKLKK